MLQRIHSRLGGCRVLGHTQANTTSRYVNANGGTAKLAAAALDALNAEATVQAEAAEMVNSGTFKHREFD